MRTVVSNGLVVAHGGLLQADVAIEGERIVDVGPQGGPPPDRVIDASGRYVLPGAIDPHTHLDLPVGDCVSSDDFASGTIAAALGGTTTILDFATPDPGESLAGALEKWMHKAQGRAAVDFGFHVIVCDVATATTRALLELVDGGVTSVKVFMAYPGRLMLDDGAIFEVMRRCRECGVLPMLHAENGAVIDVLVRQALREGRTSARARRCTSCTCRPPARWTKSARQDGAGSRSSARRVRSTWCCPRRPTRRQTTRRWASS